MRTKKRLRFIDEYDPYHHRQIKHPITNVEAFISILKCSIGTGCLEMPRAFCNAGWLNGFIGTFLIGFITVYSLNILMFAMYDVCQRHKQAFVSYPDCLRIALQEGPACFHKFSNFANFTVNFFMTLYHYGVCCVYILFIADNFKQLGDEFFSNLNFHLYIIALTGPLILLFLIRDLKHLVPFAFLANVFLCTGILIIWIYIIEDLPPLSTRSMFNSPDKYPLFFGTVLFAMESVGVIIAIENNMKNPRDYMGLTGIMALGTFLSLTVYSVFGFFGYWRFGCDVFANIALNISKKTALSEMSKLFLAFAIYFSYALQGYIIVDVIWHQFLSSNFNEHNQTIFEYNTRCILVLTTILGAVVAPDLSVFLPLIGAFCVTILSFILPGLIDLCVKYQFGYGPGKIILIRDILIICFGILGCITGTWVTTVNFRMNLDEIEHHNQTVFYYTIFK